LRTLEGADLLVTLPVFGSVTVPAVQHLDIRVVVGQLFPMLLPTAAWSPPIPAQNRDFGSVVNRAAWRAFAWGSGAAMHDRAMNRYRRSLVEPLHGAALLSWTAPARTVVLVIRHSFGYQPGDCAEWRREGFSV
jgi:hypothetical protein